jgi:hypothetical protein
MLVRLGVVISMVGRIVWFAAMFFIGTILAMNYVDVMCGTTMSEIGQQSIVTAILVTLLIGGLTLVFCSTLAWIILGVGDLISFGFYLLTRAGTMLLISGVFMIGWYLSMYTANGRCSNGSWQVIIGSGVGVVLLGWMLQLATMMWMGLHYTKDANDILLSEDER